VRQRAGQPGQLRDMLGGGPALVRNVRREVQVDVHIANVRKKLGKDFIATRRGEGYQIHV